MLTVPPGADIEPYHNRQIALLAAGQWRAWLDGSASSTELLRSSEAGSLAVSAGALGRALLHRRLRRSLRRGPSARRSTR